MAEIKLTKNGLRAQQKRLQQLEKYLPTLQLKKAMLQMEVHKARTELEGHKKVFEEVRSRVHSFSSLLSQQMSVDPAHGAKIKQIDKRYENIAGVEVPHLQSVAFEDFTYSLYDTPPWLDPVVEGLRGMAEAQVKVNVAEEKRQAIAHELREVSIRVNLFEKILIPRARANIKKIAVFLGDQALAAVARAKVAKNKIEELRQLAKERAHVS